MSAEERLALVIESFFEILSPFRLAILSAFILASAAFASGAPFAAASNNAFLSAAEASLVLLVYAAVAGLFPLLLMSTDVGGRQFLSLHAPYSRYALML